MNKFKSLSKLAIIGVASGITATTIATIPAQAAQLSWEDGTSEFLDQTTPVQDNPGEQVRPSGDIEIFFSPDQIALISAATGQFTNNPGFTSAPPPYAYNNLGPVGGTEGLFDDMGLAPNEVSITLYELEEDLVFDFNNGVVVTYAEGSEFFGEYDFAPDQTTIEGIELELREIANGSSVVSNGETYLLPTDPNFDPDFVLTGITLVSEEPAGGEVGGFAASVTKSTGVPEPASILGVLAVGGLGLGLKRKKQ